MLKIVANQISESIDIKWFRKSYSGSEYYFTSSEVFYKGENEKFHCIRTCRKVNFHL